ncbi:polysaccharide biosynthesis protein [Thermomonas carbonis]|nr:polysaccharide biosynthesis protein [Thermomonas carbonis]
MALPRERPAMHDDRFARLPKPPYYAVIFSSLRRGDAADGYAEAATRMDELARVQPGFLGVESARDNEGFGITTAYFDSEASIKAWRGHDEHASARQRGRDAWYAQFAVRVAKVERAYEWECGNA